MTLHAAIEAQLPFLRAEANSRMTSTATARIPSGEPVPDPETDLLVPGWADVVTDSPFRLGGANTGSSGTRTVTIGQSEVQVAVRVGHFPHGTTTLPDGAVIEITAGENAGMFLRVVEGAGADQQTAYRVPVVETQRPEGWV